MRRTQRRPRRVTRGADPRIEPKRAAQAPNVDHVRPPTRARCGQAARRDLRGRCRVTGTSTRHAIGALGKAVSFWADSVKNVRESLGMGKAGETGEADKNQSWGDWLKSH